jgi:hypothetical protein
LSFHYQRKARQKWAVSHAAFKDENHKTPTVQAGQALAMYVVRLKSSVNGTENKQNRRYKLTLLAFKIIVILQNTLLATFIKLLETVSKGLFRN